MKIYLWPEASNQPLNIKIGRETKLKKIEEDIARKLTTEQIKLVDDVIAKHYIEHSPIAYRQDAKPSENPTSTQQTSSISFLDKWNQIKESPEKFDVKSFWFKKTWRYLGAKGRWVYIYSLWSLSEMVKRRGRRRVIQGYLLEPPVRVIDEPLEWEEWERRAVKEYKRRGFKMTPERYKRLQRYYKRLPKEKVLALVFVPTWTTHYAGSILERTTDFGEMIVIGNSVLFQLEESAKLPMYKAIVETTEVQMLRRDREILNLTQKLGGNQQLIRKLHEEMERTRVPIQIAPEGSPFPMIPSPPPPQQPTAMREKLKMKPGQPEDILNLLLILLGLLGTVWGLIASSPLPLVAGVVLLVFSSFLWFRRKKTVKLPESLEERAEEATSMVTGD